MDQIYAGIYLKQFKQNFYLVYIETGKELSAGSIAFNIGATGAAQTRTWKVKVRSIRKWVKVPMENNSLLYSTKYRIKIILCLIFWII